MADAAPWGSDVPVSLPEPRHVERPVYVDMGGFGFTEFGLGHQFTESDWENYLPHYAPGGGVG